MFLKKRDNLQWFCDTVQYINRLNVFYIKFIVICKVYITDCIIFAYHFQEYTALYFLVKAIGIE